MSTPVPEPVEGYTASSTYNLSFLNLRLSLRLFSLFTLHFSLFRILAAGFSLFTLHSSLFTLHFPIPGFRKNDVSQKRMTGEHRDRPGSAGTRAKVTAVCDFTV